MDYKSYLSAVLVTRGFLSLLLIESFFLMDRLLLGADSCVSLERTAVLGKRTVCGRVFSLTIFVRLVIAFDVDGAPPLAVVFNAFVLDVDVSILADASKLLLTPLLAVPLIEE